MIQVTLTYRQIGSDATIRYTKEYDTQSMSVAIAEAGRWAGSKGHVPIDKFDLIEIVPINTMSEARAAGIGELVELSNKLRGVNSNPQKRRSKRGKRVKRRKR